MQVASKKVYWKNNRVFQTLVPYCHWKIYFIYQNLTDAFFQISLKYIKLVIPKILFILVLCSLIFTSKLLDPPNKINPPPPKKKFVMPSPPAKTFLKFWIPQAVEGAGVHTLLNWGLISDFLPLLRTNVQSVIFELFHTFYRMFTTQGVIQVVFEISYCFCTKTGI